MWTVILFPSCSDPSPPLHHQPLLFQCFADFEEISKLLKQPSTANYMVDAIFDYMSLLDLPYDQLFRCACDVPKDQKQRLIGVYDNACHWLTATLIRFPSLGDQMMTYVDAMHHSAHSNCSPACNSKLSAITSAFNHSLNEQKNRFINHMKSSASFMKQARMMEYIRYHLAILNMLQTGVDLVLSDVLQQHRNIKPITGLAHQSLIFDGVGIKCPKKSCHMDRPWELPYDKDQMKGKGASSLYVGCTVDRTVMIPCPKQRGTLAKLLQGTGAKCGVPQTAVSELKTWLREHKKSALLPYVDTVVLSDAADSQTPFCTLNQDSLKLILPVLKHWASPVPELQVIPAALMLTVSQILTTKSITPQQNREITSYSELLRLLVLHDKRRKSNSDFSTNSGDEDSEAASGNATPLSPTMVALLKEMLYTSQRCLDGESGAHKTKGWPIVSPKLGAEADLECEREGWSHMVRSGSYFPGNPVFRRLQYCKHDFLNEQSRKRRDNKNQDPEGVKEAAQELKMESERMGLTCNKYKEKSSKLTPGLFTVFCLGCSVCVGFELMDDPESPLTAFKIFAHRAWTKADFETREKWLRYGEWNDTVAHLPSYARRGED